MNEETLFSLPEGKLRISRAKAGSSGAHREMQSCLLTFIDLELDSAIRKAFGVTGLRRHKLLRVTGEAYEQSVELAQELVSFDLLGCGLRTLQRDIALFAAHGVRVPFVRSPKGQRSRRFTYKVAAAKLYLEGKNREEIARCLYQSLSSVQGFIQDFARFARLASSGISPAQIQTVINCSGPLMKELHLLFLDYNTPQLFKRLDLFAHSAR
jgi:hypothetical protein